MQRYTAAPGMIVRATAGSEAGRFFLVTAVSGTELMLADGKRRTLARPKRKNPLHVALTRQTLPLEGLTDRALRRALAPLNDAVSQPQSRPNENRSGQESTNSQMEVIADVEAGCN